MQFVGSEAECLPINPTSRLEIHNCRIINCYDLRRIDYRCVS